MNEVLMFFMLLILGIVCFGVFVLLINGFDKI